MATTVELGTTELQARVEQISTEAKALGSTVETTIRDVEATLRARMDQHPYAMLAAAAGVGYVLGGGVPSRLTSLLLGIGTRAVLDYAARDLTARLANGDKR
jgi:hypothetical protein